MQRYKDDYLGYKWIWFFGVVEDRNDPLQLGRVRVRALSWYSMDKEKVPTEALPWAHTMLPCGSTAFASGTGILEGSWVLGFFLDGEDAQQPVILGRFPGIPQCLPDASTGAQDPNSRYPDNLNEPETSRAGRGGEQPIAAPNLSEVSPSDLNKLNPSQRSAIQGALQQWREGDYIGGNNWLVGVANSEQERNELYRIASGLHNSNNGGI